MFKSVNLLRLNQGQEVLSALSEYCRKKGISSAIILGCIGSLDSAKFGTAPTDGKWGFNYDEFTGHMSIISGQGSLSKYQDELIFHIHMTLIDPGKPGQLIGGHLEEGRVWATVEIYIGELNYQLERDFDDVIGMSALRTT